MANGTRVATGGESGENSSLAGGSQIGSERSQEAAGSGASKLRGFLIRGALPGKPPSRRRPSGKLPAALFSLFIHHKITQRAGVARRVGERAAVPSEGTGRGRWNLAAKRG